METNPNAPSPDSWIANPKKTRYSALGHDEQKLVDRRADLVVIGQVNDAEACYSYDDYALVLLDGAYYLLNTSGCSCPDPDETWGIVCGPATLDEIETHLIADAENKGYGVTKRQADEFRALVDRARELAS